MAQFKVGDEVRVFGLVNKPKFNGAIGTVRSYITESGRFGIEIKLKNNRTKAFAFKPANLNKLWIGLDVKFAPLNQEDIPSMKDIMTAWGFVISELTGCAEEFVEIHEWQYLNQIGQDQEFGSNPFEFHQKNCITGMDGCTYGFEMYQELDETDCTIEEKALLFRSEEQLSQYLVHILETHSEFEEPIIKEIASMIYKKPTDEDFMNFIRCEKCNGFTLRKIYWSHFAKLVDCFRVVTDILFTETLEELQFKYGNWREKFERHLLCFGELWTELVIEERKRLTTQHSPCNPKAFIFVQCPKDGDMKKTRVVDFRLLSDRAIATLIFAEGIKLKSPYQLFKSEPKKRPSISEVLIAQQRL